MLGSLKKDTTYSTYQQKVGVQLSHEQIKQVGRFMTQFHKDNKKPTEIVLIEQVMNQFQENNQKLLDMRNKLEMIRAKYM